MKNFFLFLVATALTVSQANAQSGFSDLIKAGPVDATAMTNAYGKPVFKGLGLGSSTGWTNTAQTLDLLHFDLRITGTVAFVPSDDKTFDVTKIGLTNKLRPTDPANVISPTFAGEKHSGPSMSVYDDQGHKVSSFTMPAGLIPFVPTPQIQVTAGLLYNTDVTLRGMPKITLSHNLGSISMIGFGIKHNIAQDFSDPYDEKSDFDFAVAFGYDHINYKNPLSVTPEKGSAPADPSQIKDFTNQHIDGNINALMFEAILSKDFSFITPFVAVGYNSSKTNLTSVGNYPVTNSVAPVTNQKLYVTYTDPVKINQTSINSMRAEAGFQIKVTVVRIYSSYTISQKYSMINAGIGFGI